jgi:hypothetical protein
MQLLDLPQLINHAASCILLVFVSWIRIYILQMYLKSRLNCLLCHSNIVTGRTDGDVEKSAKDARVKDHNDNNNGDNDADQQDVEELWDQMDTVTSTKVKKLKRTRTRDEGTVTVKKKKLKKTVS